MTTARYDFAPLWDAVQAPTFLEFSRRVRVNARQLYRWARSGIPDDRADHIATAVGSLPYEIWPEWLWGDGSPQVTDWMDATSAERARRRAEEEERRRVARETLAAAEPKRSLIAEQRCCEHCGWPFIPKSTVQRFCRLRCSEESRCTEAG